MALIIRCPDCGREVSTGTPGCLGCGRSMRWLRHDEAVCPSCKEAIHRDAKECPHCGRALPQIQSETPKRPTFPTLALAIPVGLCATLVAIVLLNREPPRGPDTSTPALQLPPVPAPEPAASSCDVSEQWDDGLPKDGLPDGFMDTYPATVTKRLSAWSADCRLQGMHGLCDHGCPPFQSDAVVNAATGADEQGALRKVRLDANAATVKQARGYYAQVKKWVDYAQSIMGTPRGNPHATTDEELYANSRLMAQCLPRQQSDVTRITSLQDELLAKRGVLDPNSIPIDLHGTLTDVHMCINCYIEKLSCEEMRESLSNANKDIAELESLIAADRKALASLATKRAAAH